ncbi:YbaB/EbfC family nucleoid-associated protein [Treponema sp. OMZ 840]|uniref:YbaB/EbfC family nucleoid-associated protein n=1 Tax=Treponema sp. OMZ 840 TaxID=244313 RepID=UPI003D906634
MNPFDLLKNAQNIQGELAKIQDELKTVSETGSSGGGIVKVSMNGSFQITAVLLDPVAVDPRDVPMLQDLIVAAAHDAQERVQQAIKEKMGPMMHNLNIPGLNLSGLLGMQ